MSASANEACGSGEPATPLERLAARQLVFVSGKGGTGKTTLAATLGWLFARLGRRVLLLELDPRENAHRQLGVRPSGGEVVDAGGGLWVQNLRPRDELDRLVLEHLRLELLARRVLDSPVYRHFAEAAPGLEELALLAYARRIVEARGREDRRFDVVVLDAPATGHALALVGAPLDAAEVVRQGPIGRAAEELARFVGDPRRAAIVVVTQAEELPAQEALELVGALERRVGRAPDLLVINALWPPIDGVPDDARHALWRRRRQINERELRRLEAAWDGPHARLPLLPLDGGPPLVRALGERLAEALAGEAG